MAKLHFLVSFFFFIIMGVSALAANSVIHRGLAQTSLSQSPLVPGVLAFCHPKALRLSFGLY